jgi:hypothetical protein
MADDDVRIREQRGAACGGTVIGKDLGLERRFDLGQDPWSNRRGKTAEKEGFHLKFSVPTLRSAYGTGRGFR